MPIPIPPIPGPGGVIVGTGAGLVADAVNAAGDVVKGVTSAIPGVDQLGDVVDVVRAVRAWSANRHNWVRVAWFGGGVVLFTVGAVMVGERPISNATTAVVKPVGKVINSAYKG